jgi:hypothetical protein
MFCRHCLATVVTNEWPEATLSCGTDGVSCVYVAKFSRTILCRAKKKKCFSAFREKKARAGKNRLPSVRAFTVRNLGRRRHQTELWRLELVICLSSRPPLSLSLSLCRVLPWCQPQTRTFFFSFSPSVPSVRLVADLFVFGSLSTVAAALTIARKSGFGRHSDDRRHSLSCHSKKARAPNLPQRYAPNKKNLQRGSAETQMKARFK